MLLLLGWFELWTQYPGSVVPLAMFLVIRIVFHFTPRIPTILLWPSASATCIWHWVQIARNCLILAPSIVLSWYHHQPESHQQSFTKFLDIERPGPIDRTPETPRSGKNAKIRIHGWEIFTADSNLQTCRKTELLQAWRNCTCLLR